ncbi:bifunctional (p)ppGpp synthetase/guanosine-3',5'-bis(diphosphate) 3'-pyrophosphohydrolase [Candidatus Peregrinibacteria bacterium]|nr:MAG: bifunctional (p)ppGpp synthetase/guanosine-3',5'-bis(diphosphate) 3'-pyrophosphohydrolase [Candidatus Peregrinibacteria bacterium]
MLHSTEDALYAELLKALKKSPVKVRSERLDRAYRFAKQAHEGQFRASGDAYVCHPLNVAIILAKLRADEESLIAALLHDVPEDTDYTFKDIETRFGRSVRNLVQAVTKLSKVHYHHSMDARQVDSLRRVFLETAKDVRVALIKLADRLHNMRTLRYLRPDKQQRIAKETLEVFAPLANLYGIFQVRRELEDLCFKVLQPEEYGRIESFVMEHEKKRQIFIRDTIAVLKKEFKRWKIPVQVEGRPKHFYSIYLKTVLHHKPLGDIYDYFAIRVVTHGLEDCYRSLAVVHGLFKPKPGRFKDYIAFPKANGYQSLHTTVVGLEGKLTEVQIRSEAMHHECELGAAAHFLYKDFSSSLSSKKLSFLKHYKNPEGFIRTLQEDVLRNRIFVFSSDGEVVDLPEGACVLDFVYARGIAVNEYVLKPMVNNKNYSLLGTLQSGDHVQILFDTRRQKGPERGWLDHVKTSKAKTQIRAYFKEQTMGTRIQLGTRLLQQELDHQNQGLVHHLDFALQSRALIQFEFDSFDELLAAIGEGTLSSSEVYKVLFPELVVGPGVKLLRVWHSLKRRFNFGEEDYKYRIKIIVEAYDRIGLLREILEPFYELKLPILFIKGSGYDVKRDNPFLSDGSPANPECISRDQIEILLEDYEQLIALFDRLERIPGVLRVQRAFRQKTAGFITLLLVTTCYFLVHPFAIQHLKEMTFEQNRLWTHVLVYSGLFFLFGLLVWLRSMGNKTFPHFEETRRYWGLSFGVTFFAIGVVFADNALYHLQLNLFLTSGLSLLILIFLLFAYRRHVKQSQHHLNRLRMSEARSEK